MRGAALKASVPGNRQAAGGSGSFPAPAGSGRRHWEKECRRIHAGVFREISRARIGIQTDAAAGQKVPYRLTASSTVMAPVPT